MLFACASSCIAWEWLACIQRGRKMMIAEGRLVQNNVWILDGRSILMAICFNVMLVAERCVAAMN